MKFFLYEVVARVVAIYLCQDCVRQLWRGLREGKVARFGGDLLDWWPRPPAYRAATPVQFWMAMSHQAFAFAACLFAAIFGWRLPGA